MEERILESILKRPGTEGNEELIKDMIADSVQDIRSYLNYNDEEDIPSGLKSAIKELTLIRYNRDGAEGIQSESQSSGGSVSYIDTLPEGVKRTIRRYRRLPR